MSTEIAPIYRVIGKTGDEAEEYLENAKRALHLIGTEKLPGETEKTEDELKTIETLRSWVQEEIHFLGLDLSFKINPDQIHFLQPQNYWQKRNEKANNFDGAFFTADTGAITQIKRPRIDFRTIRDLVHELSHAASYRIISLLSQDEGIPSILGYREIKDDRILFTGLNEITTESFSDLTLRFHSTELKQMLCLKKIPFGKGFAYSSILPIFEDIVSAIALTRKLDLVECFELFHRNMFTGDRSNLEDIDKVYGPKSLEVLANMANNGMKQFFEQYRYFEEYFDAANPIRRAEIAEVILHPTSA